MLQIPSDTVTQITQVQRCGKYISMGMQVIIIKWWIIKLLKTLCFCTSSLEINQWNVHCFWRTPVIPCCHQEMDIRKMCTTSEPPDSTVLEYPDAKFDGDSPWEAPGNNMLHYYLCVHAILHEMSIVNSIFMTMHATGLIHFVWV